MGLRFYQKLNRNLKKECRIKVITTCSRKQLGLLFNIGRKFAEMRILDGKQRRKLSCVQSTARACQDVTSIIYSREMISARNARHVPESFSNLNKTYHPEIHYALIMLS